MQRLLAVLSVAALLTLNGCAGFFSDPNTTTSTSTGSTVGDFVYVVNEVTDSVLGLSLATGALVNVSTSAYSLQSGLVPTSAVVSRANTYLFVGGEGAIYCYSIGSGGVITLVTGAGTTTTGDVVSMATSPDGQWLLALSNSTTATGVTISVYGINTSTGVLTQQSSALITFPSASIGTEVPNQIKIAPNADYVAVSLGAAGAAFFDFTTSTGVLTQSANVNPSTSSGSYLSNNSIAFNPASTELFVGTTGLVTGTSFISAYPISTAGVLGTPQTVTSGDSPASLETDSTGAYLYSANLGSGTLTGYTISSAGALTAMATSPFAASIGIKALSRDQSGLYMLAVSEDGGTAGVDDVTMYAFDQYTKGQLDPISVIASGTNGALAIAATH